MAERHLKESFDNEFDQFQQTVDRMISEAIDDTGFNHLDSYKELGENFDKNVIEKLPDIQTIFKELDAEVSKLEIESSELDECLSKMINKSAVKSDTFSPTLLTPPHQKMARSVMSAVQEAVQSTSGNDFKRAKIEMLKTHLRYGRIRETVLHVGLRVLGLCKDEWKQGCIIGTQKHKDKLKYKVRFDNSRGKSLLQVGHLACLETRTVFGCSSVPAGSRVAASYKNDGIYSGVVAEAADRNLTKGRLLIFFDDGYATYCFPNEVYLVYGPQVEVWNDITQKGTADFIKDYLTTTERQMLSLREGQTLKVEFDGDWHQARCVKIDCSLVEVLYMSDNSKEWIYRGSARLEPLYKQKHLKARPGGKPNRIARAHTGMRRAHIEFVDLTGDHPDQWEAPWSKSLNDQKTSSGQSAPTKIPDTYSELTGGYDVASRILKKRKSFEKTGGDNAESRPAEIDPHKRFEDKADDGIVVDSLPLQLLKNSTVFSPHSCSPQCVAAFSCWTADKLRGANPIIKPLLCGWTRELCHVRSGSHAALHHIYYRTPCGRACRNMSDVERYMIECGIRSLDYDHFSFDHTVRPLTGQASDVTSIKRPPDAKIFIRDYSGGIENMPISCVNEINFQEPPQMPYTKLRIPGKGVKINTSPDFMVCCDCEDNCRDKSKCACQQLTVQATSCCRGGKVKKDAGYKHKRLFTFLPTGIYECNKRCKCNSQCRNRVVQKGLQCRLQLFKTHKKGWGIRCLDDIARGTFMCVYTGMIQTEDNANQEGLEHGDEYLAELDHIEVAENQKDVYNSDGSSGIDSQNDDSDDELSNGNSDRLSRRQDSTDTDEDVIELNTILPDRSLGAAEVYGGQKRKFGYSVEPVISPPILPETIQKRRGKSMVMRKPQPAIDSKSETGSLQSRSTASTRNDDTTDTDSDVEVVVTRPPTARKSTTARLQRRTPEAEQFESDDADDDNKDGTRRFFGSGGGMFIIDAKQTGNLGRYLNHSCTPNLMVQNVFIDTHDLRFPWVAFFASESIRSGHELTWDYNYEIGSVPGRIIHCYCGATKCRKRLL